MGTLNWSRWPKAAVHTMMVDSIIPKQQPEQEKHMPARDLLQANTVEGRRRTPSPATAIETRSHYRQVNARLEIEQMDSSRGTPAVSGKRSVHAASIDRIRAIGEYRLKKTMDTGSTGSVKLAMHRQTGEEVAIKLVPRALLAEQSRRSRESLASKERRILREAAIHHLLRHPNIVSFHDFIITEDYYCIVMEYVDGGKLLDYITQHRQIKERQARKFFRQLISAVSYLHHNAIVHRDLKIENVLVDRRGNVRLIDFGLANFFDPNERLATFCGSLYFAAPELLHGRPYVGPEVDVWSLGVILYTMVCGSVPFDDKSLPALHEKIKAGRLHVPSHVSEECRHLLHRMICVDPTQRITMRQLAEHAWVNRGYEEPIPLHLPDRPPLATVDGRIVEFLCEEFQIQFSRDEVFKAMEAALSPDWQAWRSHPVVNLYYLAKEKMACSACTPRLTGYLSLSSTQVGSSHSSGSSRSLISTPSAANMVTRQRSLSLSLPPAPASQTNPLYQAALQEDFEAVPLASSSQGWHPPRGRADSLPHSGNPRLQPPGNRSNSLAAQAENLPSPIPSLRVRTVWLRGLFTVNTTSTRSPTVIRQELIRSLRACAIPFIDNQSYFICEHTPSYRREDEDARNDITLQSSQPHDLLTPPPSPTPSLKGKPADPIVFEIHIVRIALVGLYGIQFKKIRGDFVLYKRVCSLIMDEAKL